MNADFFDYVQYAVIYAIFLIILFCSAFSIYLIFQHHRQTNSRKRIGENPAVFEPKNIFLIDTIT